MASLSSLQLKGTTEVEILHPVKGDVGVTFTVQPPQCAEYNKALGKIVTDKTLAALTPNLNDTQIWQINQAEALVVGWDGITDDEGNPIEWSPEQMRNVFRDKDNLYFWMVLAVAEYVESCEGFIEAMKRKYASTLKQQRS